MKEFTIYNSLGQKTKVTIDNIKLALTDCARLDIKYHGKELKGELVSYGGGHKKPFIRFWNDDSTFIDAVFTNEVIEYIWHEIGCPYTGLLYGYTENYKANWCD